MKIAKTGLAAAVVLVFAVCSISPVPKEKNLSNTILTGQVLQMEDNVVTLGLGELALLQTPEIADSARTHEGVPLSEAATEISEVEMDTARTFVSWEQDAVLDLSEAQVFSVNPTGQIQSAMLADVMPQDIVTVAVGSDNLATMVTILTEEEHDRAESEALQGAAANTITENRREHGAEYLSAADDENALRVASATVNLRNVRVEKSDGTTSNAFGSSHYGLNATLLATGGAQLTLSDGTINSSALGGDGVFSHGAGTMIYLNGGAVTTTADDAGGIQTAGGAGVYVKGATVITAGDSAAVIRAGSGGTGVQLEGGTYTSGGYDSPVICASGSVRARNAEFTANNSQVVVVEGSGDVSLDNCSVTGKMSEAVPDSEEACAVAVYAPRTLPENEQGTFSMSGGSLTSLSGDMFHVTDAACTIELKNVALETGAGGALLRAMSKEGNTSVTLNANRQELAGDILVDSAAAVQLNLQEGSRYTGAVRRTANTAEGAGDISIYIAPGCTWSLTGDSVADTIQNEGTILYNGYTVTLADGTVLAE